MNEFDNLSLTDLFLLFEPNTFKSYDLNNNKLIINSVINKFCQQQNLPEIPVRFVNEGLDDYGTFNPIFENININLDVLLEEENSSYKILDVIIHELHHYEQFLHGKGAIKYGVENPLPITNKYYHHQPHEKDAYNYTFDFLRKIYKELKLEGLDIYETNERRKITQKRKQVGFLEHIGINKKIKNEQKNGIKGNKLIEKYASDMYPKQTCMKTIVNIEQRNDSNIPIGLKIYVEESPNFLNIYIGESIDVINNIEDFMSVILKNSINLKIKDNKAIIFLNDYLPPPENIKMQVEFAINLIHKYNQDNNLNIEDVLICPEAPNIDEKYLMNLLRELNIEKDKKTNINKKVDQTIINIINKKIDDEYFKSLLTIGFENKQPTVKINKTLLSLDVLDAIIKRKYPDAKLKINNKNIISSNLENYIKNNNISNKKIIEILEECNLIKHQNEETNNPNANIETIDETIKRNIIPDKLEKIDKIQNSNNRDSR